MTVMLCIHVLQVYRLVKSGIVLHMAQTERRDAPELPDFSLLKRLARDQLIFLLEQVSGTESSPHSLNVTTEYYKDSCFASSATREKRFIH